MEDNGEKISTFRVQLGDLVSNSTGKGSGNMADTGFTMSPPIARIFLRSCWSISPMKYRDLHHEKSGDQYIGREIIGVLVLRTNFTVSPVYFDAES